MPYPTVSEANCRSWYTDWSDACVKEGERVQPPYEPRVEESELGDEVDWVGIAQSVVKELSELWDAHDERVLESKGAVLVHRSLPDHEALRDPEFWYWLASVPGRELIDRRYPYKAKKKVIILEDGTQAEVSPAYLPGRSNFVGGGAKEVMFFRFWIRAEMALVLGGDADDENTYEYVRPGFVDFWRSHVFRQLYAHHRPFVQAFVDFQFPTPGRNKARLNTAEIRQLASDLSKACANVIVELLDMAQCRALIDRQWEKTQARMEREAQEKLAAE